MGVKVDEVVGVAGFVLPGTRVDVLVTVDQLAKYEEPTTKVILQNITVLAAGQTVQENEQGEPQTVTVVTLVVTPDEGEKLALSSSKGRIQLARNPIQEPDHHAAAGLDRTATSFRDTGPGVPWA